MIWRLMAGVVLCAFWITILNNLNEKSMLYAALVLAGALLMDSPWEKVGWRFSLFS